jgi:DNA-directed RNA polymerase subunit RPC12/RpoP
MSMIDVALGNELFRLHKGDRTGINRKPEMAHVCLICGSIHIDVDAKDGRKLVCRNCGHAFYRYACPSCGQTVDNRDPANPPCPACRSPRCVCGGCGCGRPAS